MEYPLIDISEVDNTRDRILLTSVKLFSERGYAAVSVRDIAESVNIKPASIYNHFESKEKLFDTIIDTIKDVYLDFYNRTDIRLEKATCFEDALECLFSELKEVYHMFIYYGLSLVTTEQFRNDKARHAFIDVYMKVGIEYSTKVFNDCIKKNWVKKFDTETLATLFMNSVLAGSLMRAQEDLGHEVTYDPNKMFKSLQKYMLNSVEVIN